MRELAPGHEAACWMAEANKIQASGVKRQNEEDDGGVKNVNVVELGNIE